MPTHVTDVATKQTPVEAADTWSRDAGNKQTGNLLFIDATYTLTSGTDETSGDLINICKIPANAKVVPHLCKISAENPGTAFNIAKIGLIKCDVDGSATDDDDAVSTAIDISAGGAFDFAWAAQAIAQDDVAETEDMWLQAELGTITSPTAGQKVRFLIAIAPGV